MDSSKFAADTGAPASTDDELVTVPAQLVQHLRDSAMQSLKSAFVEFEQHYTAKSDAERLQDVDDRRRTLAMLGEDNDEPVTHGVQLPRDVVAALALDATREQLDELHRITEAAHSYRFTFEAVANVAGWGVQLLNLALEAGAEFDDGSTVEDVTSR